MHFDQGSSARRLRVGPVPLTNKAFPTSHVTNSPSLRPTRATTRRSSTPYDPHFCSHLCSCAALARGAAGRSLGASPLSLDALPLCASVPLSWPQWSAAGVGTAHSGGAILGADAPRERRDPALLCAHDGRVLGSPWSCTWCGAILLAMKAVAAKVLSLVIDRLRARGVFRVAEIHA